MRATLLELARVFLLLGVTAFGGPAAHVALMEEQLVRRRQWLSREEFLDLVGATNLIPGPNSTEMAIHIGRLRAGWPGLAVAGACFILPAAVLVTLLAWLYVRFGATPQLPALFWGIKPVIVALLVQAFWGLGRTALKSTLLAFVAVAATVASFVGASELPLLLGGGVLAFLAHVASRPQPSAPAPAAGFLLLSALSSPASFSLGALFLFFLKVGSVLFGSGYVLFAFLRADLVENRGWLTDGQLLDAIAVGQLTPGPVFTAATFVGYLLGRLPGAAVATAGIFLPAFLFVALSAPLIARVRRSPAAGAFLDGVIAASLALLFVVSVRLARGAIVDVSSSALFLAALVALLRFRVNSVWLVLAGGAVGLAKSFLPL